jgi:hypothetical protein
VELEAKFAAGARRGWDFSLAPGFSLPAGDDARGLGAGENRAWFSAIAGRRDGGLQYHLNAGYTLNNGSAGEERHLFGAAAMAGAELSPKFLLAAELAVETNSGKDAASHPLYSTLGAVWYPSPSLDLSAGVRIGLNGAADDLGLLAGLTIRL